MSFWSTRRPLLTFLLIAAGVAALLLIVLLPYLPGSGLVIDDESLVNIPQLRHPLAWKSLVAIFTPGWHVDFYPVRDLSYWLDIHVLGANPGIADMMVYRAHNLALIAVSASLLWAILAELGHSRAGILLAVLWGAHPFHFETILWASARKDALAITFALLSVLSFIKWVRAKGNPWILLCAISFLLSLLSKASFSLLPGVGCLWFLFWGNQEYRRENRSRTRMIAALLVLSILGLSFATLQSRFYAQIMDMRIFYPWEYRWQSAAAAFARMAAGWIDIRQNAIDVENWGEWLELNHVWIIPGLALWISCVVSLFLSVRKKSRIGILTWAAFFLLYLPVSGLGFAHRNFYSVRYAEAPCLALALGCTLWTARFPWRLSEVVRRHSMVVAGLLAIPLALIGSFEAENWSSGPRIFAKSLARTPENISLAYLRLLEMKQLMRWGRLTIEERKEVEENQSRLLALCSSEDRFHHPAGDLCWSFWSHRILGKDELQEADSKPFLSAAESQLHLYSPHGQDRWRARTHFSIEEQKGEISKETAKAWLELVRYLPLPEWRIRKWLALCVLGMDSLARNELNTFMESHLLDRADWAEFLSARNLLWTRLKKTGMAGRCGLGVR